MIYLDSCALLKFIKPEGETEALRAWRSALPDGVELVTSELAAVEITRTLLRAGVEHRLVPYYIGQALMGIYRVDVTPIVLSRAQSFQARRLGSLDAIHLSTAEPFRAELTELITYDRELAAVADELGFPVNAPG